MKNYAQFLRDACIEYSMKRRGRMIRMSFDENGLTDRPVLPQECGDYMELWGATVREYFRLIDLDIEKEKL